MNFNSVIQMLMKERGLRQADLCRMTQIPSSLMSDYVSGKKSPALNNAMAIADALSVSLDELTGRIELRSAVLSAREEELVNGFRLLDERGKQTIEGLLRIQFELTESKLNNFPAVTSEQTK